MCQNKSNVKCQCYANTSLLSITIPNIGLVVKDSGQPSRAFKCASKANGPFASPEQYYV